MSERVTIRPLFENNVEWLFLIVLKACIFSKITTKSLDQQETLLKLTLCSKFIRHSGGNEVYLFL